MKITGIDKQKSSTENGLADRYLILDDYPSPTWAAFFPQVHQGFFSTAKRRARLEGHNIVVHCLLDELQQQINDLQGQCKETTRLADVHDDDLKRRQEDYEAQQKAQRLKADEGFDNLKFD